MRVGVDFAPGKDMAEELGAISKRRPGRPQPLPVEFQVIGVDERSPGWLSEFTLAGAMLETSRGGSFELGTRLRIFMRVFGIDEEISLRSVVRWDRRTAVGVQFFRLGDREVHLLMEAIAAAESVARSAGPTRRST